MDDLGSAKRVVVFNHFDNKGVIHDYVIYYLQELKRAGFTVVFTSNSPRFPKASVETLKPLVARILWRSNVGYDFGAFKDGIAQVPDLSALDMLLVTNDSIYGPLQDLVEIIDRADPAKADIWGITDCWSHYFHLQSYFVLFHPKVLKDRTFRHFWGRLPYFRNKHWVVKYGEIGLTQFFLRHGLRCQALFPYRALVASVSPRIEAYLLETKPEKDPVRYRYLEMMGRFLREGVALNQTHFFWDELLVSARCPFIKRDLLQRNPVGIPFLQHWETLMQDVSSYDSKLIVKHLEHSMRNRVY
ncbi:rhamnan synthesis F family protein [Niveispirillum sp.]|uniref:rhamnan synthesis F family protein n=1 Tax=Niveispirillum sp. TaxID=1917217 RepID=UPI001B5A780B|nr:rhamnan synthesis F family protein [Niveispirillum sp.]MBP7335241.1 polysaccharide biosynthesis-like protein [Niveispirillum sp.]